MNPPAVIRVEINGRAAGAEELAFLAMNDYGHFTAMQVRDRKVRGIDLHLKRLDTASRELFGVGLEGGRIRGHLRHALGDDIGDASVRINVFQSDSEADVSLMVTVRPPGAMPALHRLQTVGHRRLLPHIKHVGGFDQAHYGRKARADGFDEALFVGPDGAVAEGSITNIGFVEAGVVVWPDAPCLAGITMQLLERELSKAAIPWVRRTVRVADLASFEGAFVTNSRGIAAVGQIDDLRLPTDCELLKSLMQVFESAPWDQI